MQLAAGISLALMSGTSNGLFTVPMKMERHWNWDRTWLIFIITACVLLPACVVLPFAHHSDWIQLAPPKALIAAAVSGLIWGFGAICFGKCVDLLGVSVANSLALGISSALGSLLPLILSRNLHWNKAHALLYVALLMFTTGVALCGKGGLLRDEERSGIHRASAIGYVLAAFAGLLSAVFNIGFSLALPISDAAQKLHYSRVVSTNVIWLVMLPAGAIPSMVFCGVRILRSRTRGTSSAVHGRSWVIAVSMGILWSASIFLYGFAVPLLGPLGPSIGWPLCLAMGLVVSNVAGFSIGEWSSVSKKSIRMMQLGLLALLFAIVLCAASARSNG